MQTSRNVTTGRQTGSQAAAAAEVEHEGRKNGRRRSPRANKARPPLVLIEWEDAAHNGGGWRNLEDGETELGLCRSVGWLVQRNSRLVWLIPHMMPESSTMYTRGCGDMTIPASCVRRIVEIEVPRPDGRLG